MNDKKWIIPGLIIGLAVLAFPFWYNLNQEKLTPEIVLSEEARAAKQCVLPAAEMRSEHMRILDEWRELVVREGRRYYTAPDGKKYLMSLSNTCIECHHNREEFCNRCHDYASVRPYCWDCHVNPSKGFKEISK
jgi:hypothetical protein